MKVTVIAGEDISPVDNGMFCEPERMDMHFAHSVAEEYVIGEQTVYRDRFPKKVSLDWNTFKCFHQRLFEMGAFIIMNGTEIERTVRMP